MAHMNNDRNSIRAPSAAASAVSAGDSIAEATERFLLAPNNYQALWTYAEKQMNLGQQLLDQGNIDTAYHKLKAAHVCYAYIIAFSVAASKAENDKLERQSRQVYALKKTAKDLLIRKEHDNKNTRHPRPADIISASTSGSTDSILAAHRRRHQQPQNSRHGTATHMTRSTESSQINNTPFTAFDPLSATAATAGLWSAAASETHHSNSKRRRPLTTNAQSLASSLSPSNAATAAAAVRLNSVHANSSAKDLQRAYDFDKGDHNAGVMTQRRLSHSEREDVEDVNKNQLQEGPGSSLYDIMFNQSETNSSAGSRVLEEEDDSFPKRNRHSIAKPLRNRHFVPDNEKFDWNLPPIAKTTAGQTNQQPVRARVDSGSSSSSLSSTHTLTQQNARTLATLEAHKRQQNFKNKPSLNLDNKAEDNRSRRRNLFASLGDAGGVGTKAAHESSNYRNDRNAAGDSEEDDGEENYDRDCLYEDDELDDEFDNDDDDLGSEQTSPLKNLFSRSESLIDAFSERVRVSGKSIKDDLLGRVKKISSTLVRNNTPSESSDVELNSQNKRKSETLHRRTTRNRRNARRNAGTMRYSRPGSVVSFAVNENDTRDRHNTTVQRRSSLEAAVPSQAAPEYRRRAPMAPAHSVDTNYSTKPQMARPSASTPTLQRRMSRDEARALLAQALTRDKLEGWAPYEEAKRTKPNITGQTAAPATPVVPIHRSKTEPAALPVLATASNSSFRRRMGRLEFERKKEANRKLISATTSAESLPVNMKRSLCDVIKDSGFEVKAEQRVAPPDQRPYEQKVEEFLVGFNFLGP